jgi:tetratricopeptide (TPR) repeat protein
MPAIAARRNRAKPANGAAEEGSMKLAIGLGIWLLVAAILPAQTLFSFESENYRVTTDVSQMFAEEVATKLEGAHVLFSEMYHFQPEVTLRVTMFSEKARFDDYLRSIIDETRDDFVYLHYADRTKSELVGFVVEEERRIETSLLHQACVQFLKAVISNPPLWIREGIATYLERSVYSEESGRYHFKPNLSWLPLAKAAVAGPPTADTEATESLDLRTLITMENEEIRRQMDRFYPQAWALVAFLLESEDPEINRVFWDSLSALDPEMTVAENSARVIARAFDWYDPDLLERRYVEFVESLRGFNDLITEGMALYAEGESEQAELVFLKAMRLEPDNHVPYYYIGLINYDNGEHQTAEVLFKTALDLGAEPALTNYALGINAFAGNLYDDSATYLTVAKQSDPDAYGDKVDSLLSRIETLR